MNHDELLAGSGSQHGSGVFIDGESAGLGGMLLGLLIAGAVLLGVGLMLALGLLVTVPLLLLAVFALLGLCVGIVALPVLLVVALALSPLLLPLALLWWLLRRRPAARPRIAT